MRKLFACISALSVCLFLYGCGNADEVTKTTVQPAETQAEVSDWERFRAYLQENGDFVMEEDQSTDADSVIKKAVIKGKADTVLIRFEIINRANYSGYSTFGEVSAQLSLPENEQQVEVNFKTEISASKGGKKETSTYEGTYNWDISQYAEGEEVVGTAVYNYVDQYGNYTHKNETVGYKITGIIEPICDALRKALSESGLGITMADLGFVCY